MKESSLEKKLKKYVENIGGICIKLPSMFYPGIPDRLILLPKGKILFVELKIKHIQTPNQIKWEKFLTDLGFNYTIIKDERFFEFIDNAKKSS